MGTNIDTHDLQTKFTGDIILPGDALYDEARTVLIKKGTPAVIVRPKTAPDVAEALGFARSHALAVAVRSGGHSNAGHGTNDGGLVIDLKHCNAVEMVNEATHRVRVGGGAIWGDVAAALQEHGLAISSGDTKTVGVGGLTVAGGIGWMVRKYGLALDSLVEAEVVTAAGQVLRASAQENPDLFWAVRGGGGNFGVVTNFTFTAHQVGDVYAGMIMYDFGQLKALLKGWRDYMRTAPEELTTMLLVMPTIAAFGSRPPMAMVTFCYAGDSEPEAMAALDPLLHVATVLNKDIKKKPYSEVLEDAHMPQGLKAVVNNSFIADFSDELVDTIAAQNGQVLQIRSVGGAMNRVPADATAFAHRDSEALIVAPVFVAMDASPEDIDAALGAWRAIARFGKGAYINFFSESTEREVHAAYPDATLERLAAVKQQYDPDNVFSHNYNIPPKH